MHGYATPVAKENVEPLTLHIRVEKRGESLGIFTTVGTHEDRVKPKGTRTAKFKLFGYDKTDNPGNYDCG